MNYLVLAVWEQIFKFQILSFGCYAAIGNCYIVYGPLVQPRLGHFLAQQTELLITIITSPRWTTNQIPLENCPQI